MLSIQILQINDCQLRQESKWSENWQTQKSSHRAGWSKRSKSIL